MKTIILIILSLLFQHVLFASSTPKKSEQNRVFQVATIGSLAQGVYDGDYNYGSLMKKGDFGVGTFLDLNGEMVAIDGNFYQIEANGKLRNVTKEQVVPFAEVIFFRPETHSTLKNIINYQELSKNLSHIIHNKNIPYAIKIDGAFNSLKLRSLRKQNTPYPLLVKASEEQAIFNLHHVKGNVVGFWFPEYWSGIAVPGLHLHFVTQDRTTGGHVLDVNLTQAKISLEPIFSIQVHLPNTQSFADANLSAKELNSSIKKAEGDTQ